jgi:hypothetical protein
MIVIDRICVFDSESNTLLSSTNAQWRAIIRDFYFPSSI